MVERPHVVIVGGGFAGLQAARGLRRAPVRVTVVDRRNHHLFQPLLYQVATASLSPADISFPIRSIFRRQANAVVRLDEVTGIDPDERRVELRSGNTLHYDYLIVASGATHAYFGNDAWAPRAPGLKTVEDAVEIRRRFLLAFEAADQEPDPARRSSLLTFVVVGAGPTGVEMAGAMAEVGRKALGRDFRTVRPEEIRVLLVEGADRVLPPFHARLSDRARRDLERLHVEVRTDARVTGVDARGVRIGDERVDTRNVVWAAGVAASPLGRFLSAATDAAGRVPVGEDLALPDRAEIFVLGDLARLEVDGAPLPGLAPVAIQQGRHAARNLARDLRSVPRRPFRYRDRGMMATIGRAAAVAEIGRLRVHGAAAWMLWLFVHILYLIGFRNRLVVMIQWAYSYLFWRRGARLITGTVNRDLDVPERDPGGDAEEDDRAAAPTRPGVHR